ncbi:helix-turn-helix transcriptional regulator [Nocardiopsis tropica]|uniref:Response regulator transcription factor n=1 Tax=Nocardiopsis tropica TaxID=109330 RepID=A0ABV1ZZ76_9ACTN|nr:response regulator transcription factor [Nocardiopsis umidischolae]MEE2055174.1 response regulator transcription factor [Nocardiopsis umidischolae]
MVDRPHVLVVDEFLARGLSLAEELSRAGLDSSAAADPPQSCDGVDVVLVEAAHPRRVEVIRRFAGGDGPAALVIGSGVCHEAVLHCLEAGAVGFVSAQESTESLVGALRDVVRRGALGGRRLTRRQTQVLALVAVGLPNREIATRLGIRHHTVKNHVQSILGKLGVGSRTAAVVALTGGGRGSVGHGHA